MRVAFLFSLWLSLVLSRETQETQKNSLNGEKTKENALGENLGEEGCLEIEKEDGFSFFDFTRAPTSQEDRQEMKLIREEERKLRRKDQSPFHWPGEMRGPGYIQTPPKVFDVLPKYFKYTKGYIGVNGSSAAEAIKGEDPIVKIIPNNFFAFSIIKSAAFWFESDHSLKNISFYGLTLKNMTNINQQIQALSSPQTIPHVLSITTNLFVAISMISPNVSGNTSYLLIYGINSMNVYHVSISTPLGEPALLLGAFLFDKNETKIIVLYRNSISEVCLVVLGISRDFNGFTVLNDKSCLSFSGFSIESVPKTVSYENEDESKLYIISAGISTEIKGSEKTEGEFQNRAFLIYSYNAMSNELVNDNTFSMANLTSLPFQEIGLISVCQDSQQKGFWVLGFMSVYLLEVPTSQDTTGSISFQSYLPLGNFTNSIRNNFLPLVVSSAGSLNQLMRNSMDKTPFFAVTDLYDCIYVNQTGNQTHDQPSSGACGLKDDDGQSRVKILTIINEVGFIIPFQMSFLNNQTSSSETSTCLSIYSLAVPPSLKLNLNGATSFAISSDSITTSAFTEAKDNSTDNENFIINFNTRPVFLSFQDPKSGREHDLDCFCVEYYSKNRCKSCIYFQLTPILIPVTESLSWKTGIFHKVSKEVIVYVSNSSTENSISNFTLTQIEFTHDLQLSSDQSERFLEENGKVGFTMKFFEPFSPDLEVSGHLYPNTSLVLNEPTGVPDPNGTFFSSKLAFKNNCTKMNSGCFTTVIPTNFYPDDIAFIQEIAIPPNQKIHPQNSSLIYTNQLKVPKGFSNQTFFFTKETKIEGVGELLFHIYLFRSPVLVTGILLHFGRVKQLEFNLDPSMSFTPNSFNMNFLLSTSTLGKPSDKIQFKLVIFEKNTDCISWVNGTFKFSLTSPNLTVVGIQSYKGQLHLPASRLFDGFFINDNMFLVEGRFKPKIYMYELQNGLKNISYKWELNGLPGFPNPRFETALLKNDSNSLHDIYFVLAQNQTSKEEIIISKYIASKNDPLGVLNLQNLSYFFEGEKYDYEGETNISIQYTSFIEGDRGFKEGDRGYFGRNGSSFHGEVIWFSIQNFSCNDSGKYVFADFDYTAILFFSDEALYIPFKLNPNTVESPQLVWTRSHNPFVQAQVQHNLLSLIADQERCVLFIEDQGLRGFQMRYLLSMSNTFYLMNFTQKPDPKKFAKGSLHCEQSDGFPLLCLYFPKGSLGFFFPVQYTRPNVPSANTSFVVAAPNSQHSKSLFITEVSGFTNISVFQKTDIDVIKISNFAFLELNKENFSFTLFLLNKSSSYLDFSIHFESLDLISEKKFRHFDLNLAVFLIGGLFGTTLVISVVLWLILCFETAEEKKESLEVSLSREESQFLGIDDSSNSKLKSGEVSLFGFGSSSHKSPQSLT